MIVPFVPFQVLGKRILALLCEEDKPKSLLLMIDEDKPKNTFVVAGVSCNEESPVDVGDKILMKTSWTQKVTIKEVEYSIIHFDDILGIYEE